MSSFARLSRSCGRFGLMATALPRGGEISVRFSSSSLQPGATLDAVRSLAYKLQEPTPSRAPHNVTDVNTTTNSTKNEEKRRQSELAAELCEGYSSISPIQLPLSDSCERGKILVFLASDCSPSDASVVKAIDSFMKTRDGRPNASSRHHSSTFSHLQQAITPPFEEILEYLLKQNAIHGMEFLVSMREDLLRVLRWMNSTANDDECEQLPQLKALDAYLQRVFSVWFSPGMLGRWMKKTYGFDVPVCTSLWHPIDVAHTNIRSPQC
jgi:hypothetical protein